MKEMLKNLPKHNGILQKCVLECFDECATLGEVKFKLVSTLGKADGCGAYDIIETKFAEIKGIEIVK